MSDPTVTDPVQGRIVWANYLQALLVEAQKWRQDPHMQAWIEDGEGGTELAWVLYERDVMVQAVNNVRRRLGREPVDVDAVRAAERQAEGHSDYTRKWALGCAELVMLEVKP